MRRTKSVFALALVTLACSELYGPQKNELSAALELWVGSGTDDYSYEFQRSCFCSPDYTSLIRIEVFDGIVSSAIYVGSGDPVTDPTIALTIAELFDEIQAAIDNEAFSIVATYDPVLGHPVNVAIDHIKNAVDDEMAFSVSAFQFVDTTG